MACEVLFSTDVWPDSLLMYAVMAFGAALQIESAMMMYGVMMRPTEGYLELLLRASFVSAKHGKRHQNMYDAPIDAHETGCKLAVDGACERREHFLWRLCCQQIYDSQL